MKTLSIIALVLSLSAFAQGTSVPAKSNNEAYKKAHDACIAKDKNLKGAALQECIVKTEKEAETKK